VRSVTGRSIRTLSFSKTTGCRFSLVRQDISHIPNSNQKYTLRTVFWCLEVGGTVGSPRRTKQAFPPSGAEITQSPLPFRHHHRKNAGLTKRPMALKMVFIARVRDALAAQASAVDNEHRKKRRRRYQACGQTAWPRATPYLTSTASVAVCAMAVRSNSSEHPPW